MRRIWEKEVYKERKDLIMQLEKLKIERKSFQNTPCGMRSDWLKKIQIPKIGRSYDNERMTKLIEREDTLSLTPRDNTIVEGFEVNYLPTSFRKGWKDTCGSR
ncbi:hypothetical protein NPIL_241231 [Nephila pilipes]|uniref:Uncharacterized protein n=1 Tax=Nephila pilipes TaxID=299642 RepID=A0A8X6MK37_NEPPI|nr:hypothetical protein NPIL_241231 [Nephila pilipes]